MTGARIARVLESDIAELLALMRAYCDFYDSHPSDGDLELIVRSLLVDPEREGIQFLARDEQGTAVGFATLYWTWETNHGGRVGVMNDLFVDSERRGGGFGRALIEACADACRERGVRELQWQTGLDNDRAQGLYDSVGAKRSLWLDYALALED